MIFNVRVKCSSKDGATYEKCYSVNAPSEKDAKEQAKNRCKQDGYKYIGIVSCR